MIRKPLIATAIIASVVVTACSDITAPKKTILASGRSAEASRTCPAPGTGLPGALNMAHDATMFDIPMAKDAAQGNLGMGKAVTSSGC
jgi:hypothetical protein